MLDKEGLPYKFTTQNRSSTIIVSKVKRNTVIELQKEWPTNNCPDEESLTGTTLLHTYTPYNKPLTRYLQPNYCLQHNGYSTVL
jgi:hypothetical protein